MSSGAGPSRALDEPLRPLLGKAAALLADKLDIATVGDLLRHYPRRYAERGELTDFSRLRRDDYVTVVAVVEKVTTRPMRARKGTLLEAVLTDGRSRLDLTFFNQAWRSKELRPGRRGLFAGKVGARGGRLQLVHPEYELVGEADDGLPDDYAGRLIPVYRATAALPSWALARCVGVVLDALGDIDDPLPADVRDARGLPGLREAFEGVHRPADRAAVDRGRARLRFDEAFVLQVALAQRRRAAMAQAATPRRPVTGGLLDAFDARLPFTLTDGQRAVGAVVTDELARSHPMHRLLQGEVGSGKTVVALRAMLTVVDAGAQAALLAPTEVLAQQHHRSITALLGPLAEGGMLGGADVATRVTLLTGSMSTAARRAALLDVASGTAGVVVGTHALIQEKVEFFDLGLAVVDEQHRFGVEQRDALRLKARNPPHVLVMTATPIPRTVAMTVFGDLEVSTLTELPAGRSPIVSHVVPAANEAWMERTWRRVREEVAAGHQAYVVCPRIGDGSGGDDEADADRLDDRPTGDRPADDTDTERAGFDDDGAVTDVAARRPGRAVLDTLAELTDAGGPLAGLRVAALHGRLPPEEKDAVMRSFAAGELDVLVATTVVEVGVDVANATVMVVLDADRFGVSQLHQLRGRVGRGSAPGLCLLVTEADDASPPRERLDAVASTLDGFELSRLDLETRREGDVLGASQSGRRSSLRLLSVLRDEEVILDARSAALAVVDADPQLSAHPALRAEVDALSEDTRADYLEKG